MFPLLAFLLTIIIVGFVTAGLNIRFDRFFTILLLIFLFNLPVHEAVNVFLWVIMLGALYIILENKSKIAKLPKQMKIKLFIIIPIFTAIASLLGTLAYIYSSDKILLLILAILALFYGLRLIFIHFSEAEMKFEKGHPLITKLCGLLGPWISGFFLGFIGTSLKPLKIPFAVKIGKMNIKQVYLGNVITAFFASAFAIVWHLLFYNVSPTKTYNELLLGMALWAGIHFVFEITNLLFPNKFRKLFQIIIGLTLTAVSIKLYLIAIHT